MVDKNSFEKGLNSDLSKLKEQSNSYLDALNIRILTDEGSSSFAIENIKGTILEFKLPKVESTWKLDFSNITLTDITLTFDLNEFGNQNIIITNAVSKSNNELVDSLNTAFEDNLILNHLKAYYNSNYIVIYDYTENDSDDYLTGITSDDSDLEISKLTRRIQNPFILGRGYFRDTLVLLTTDASYDLEDPENYNEDGIIGTEGLIWNIPLDRATDQPIKKDGTLLDVGEYLTPEDFLSYNNILNFSRKYAIYKECKCRQENNNTARVIWTDNYNTLRTANLFDPQLQATPKELTSYLPVHKPEQPYLVRVLEGGFLPSAMYQVFYELSSLQGAVSTISPLSNLVPLGNQEPVSNFEGAVIGTISGKSIQMIVNNLDTNYDIIRFGYTIYQSNGVSQSYFYSEQAIPDSGSVTTVLNGTENRVIIDDITLLSNINRPPDVFKTIEVSRKRLFGANTKTNIVDLNFDTRVYRFNSGLSSKLYNQKDLYNSPSVELTSDGTNITTILVNNEPVDSLNKIPDTYDLINPYNNENPDNIFNNNNWFINSQFKYQLDGSTIGGSGLNLSYKFITQETFEDNTDPTKYTEAPYIRPNFNFEDNYQPGNGQSFDLTGALNTMQSPYVYSLFRGYGRGEVYRWGLVFVDIYGYPLPVKWIGDIKFPFTADPGFDLGSDSNEDGSGELNAKQLGIEFTLDTNSEEFQKIKDKISGWYYVRVKREVTDASKLGISILSTVTSSLIRSCIPYNFDNTNGSLVEETNVGIFYNPPFLKNINNQFVLHDYFRVVGTASSYGNYNGSTEDTPALDLYIKYNGFDDSYLISYRKYDWFNFTDDELLNNREITFKWSIPRSTQGVSINANPALGLDKPFYSMSATNSTTLNASEFKGYGNQLDLITFEDNSDINIANPNGLGNSFTKYLISYERFNNAQYGGSSRASRYDNEYIPTYFQPYNEDITGVVTSKVYNGDCLVTFNEYQAIEKNILADSGFNLDGDSDRMCIMYLSECHDINPKLYIYQNDNRPTYRTTDNNIYTDRIINNGVYSQEMNTTLFYSLAFNQSLITEEPTAIYVTDPKIDGERIDSWRKFRLNDTLYVDNNYDGINKLINFKDKLYFYQTEGFGLAAVEQQVTVTGSDGSETQIGTGGVLSRYDYISTETGAFNQFAVESSGNSIYHWDSNINKYFRFNPSNGVEPLSDIKGLSGLFRLIPSYFRSKDQILTADDPIGVHNIFNSQFNEIILTFYSDDYKLTIVFNELLNSFICRYSCEPTMYINMRKRLLSFVDENIFVHDKGYRNFIYEELRPSTIKFRVNKNSDLVKVYDNLQINTEVINPDGTDISEEVTISTIQCTNDYQNTNVITLIPNNNIKARMRTWRLNIPRDINNTQFNLKSRMRDKYIDIEFTYLEPESDTEAPYDRIFRLHDVISTNSLRTTILPEDNK